MLTTFLSTSILPAAYAQQIFLPTPGTMVHLSSAFAPPMLKGIKVYPENPFLIDFILDKGESKISADDETAKLVKYFLASLTTPEKDMWVNLSPYEKDRIVPESFGQTEMGRDLLAQDYLLKQITASLIYPEDELGKKFWDKVYSEAQKKFGTRDIPMNTFNKVWIVPNKAVVYENPQSASAYVLESSLKVMLEEDYVALSVIASSNSSVIASAEGTKQSNSSEIASRLSDVRNDSKTPIARNDTNQIGSQIVREIVIPALTKEVNGGKNFAQLRQVYNSLILAAWYKQKIKDSILSQIYVDKNKVAGVQYASFVIASATPSAIARTPVDPSLRGDSERSDAAISQQIASRPSDARNDTEAIYQQYLEAFKKGAYNFIKEEADPVTQEMIPRKYFSGGFSALKVSSSLEIKTERASAPTAIGTEDQIVRVQVASAGVRSLNQGEVSSSSITSSWKWTAAVSALAAAGLFGWWNYNLPEKRPNEDPAISAQRQGEAASIAEFKRRVAAQQVISEQPTLEKAPRDISKIKWAELTPTEQKELVQKAKVSFFKNLIEFIKSGNTSLDYEQALQAMRRDFIQRDPSQIDGISNDKDWESKRLKMTLAMQSMKSGRDWNTVAAWLYNNPEKLSIGSLEQFLDTINYPIYPGTSSVSIDELIEYNKQGTDSLREYFERKGNGAAFNDLSLAERYVMVRLLKSDSPRDQEYLEAFMADKALMEFYRFLAHSEAEFNYGNSGLVPFNDFKELYSYGPVRVYEAVQKFNDWNLSQAGRTGNTVRSTLPNILEYLKTNKLPGLPAERPASSGSSPVGGIDFNKDKLNVEVTNGSPMKAFGRLGSLGRDDSGIKFHIDPAQLLELQNAPGFMPIIINVQPMINLQLFLGLNGDDSISVAAAGRS